MSVAEVLAAVIRERYDMCSRPDRYPMEDSLAEYLLEHLPAKGIAVVELPNSEAVEDYGLYVSSAPHFGLPVGEEHDRGSRFRSIEETRRYAAVLLAIAATAEAAEADA